MSAPSTITSRRHPFVQRCRQIAAGRGEHGEVLLDGLHLLQDAVEAGVGIDGVLATDREKTALGFLQDRSFPIHIVTPDVIEAASPVRSPSGVVAIASWTPQPAFALLTMPSPLLIGLVGVQDPGNVGNIIRSADALGASGVLVLDGTADPGGWKALRGAMGSTFRVPVGTGSIETVLPLAKSQGIRVAATVAGGGVPLDSASLSAPILVLIGSEGSGLPSDVSDAADVHVTIPMRSRVNSLNAATTAALVIWELTWRTRGTSS